MTIFLFRFIYILISIAKLAYSNLIIINVNSIDHIKRIIIMNSTQLDDLLNKTQEIASVLSPVLELAPIFSTLYLILNVLNRTRREVIDQVFNSPHQEMLNEKIDEAEEKLNKARAIFGGRNQTYNFKNILFFLQKNKNDSVLDDVVNNNTTKSFR